jgi:predicted nucleic acid-binding protein
MKIYLDACCLCRPFDDQKVLRIHLESEAIKEILVRCTRDWILVDSDAVSFEISQIPDKTRMQKVRNLLNLAKEHVAVTRALSVRYHEFAGWGLDPPDALHLACAESAGAILLTTDDAIIKNIRRHAHLITIQIKNPVEWLREVNTHGGKDIE